MNYLPSRATAFALLVLLATACSKTQDASPAVDTSDNMLLGNPSGAVANTSSPTNYLLVKPQYAVGYNRDQGKASWVSWHLSQTDLGSAPRQDDFRADASLPSGWYQVKPADRLFRLRLRPRPQLPQCRPHGDHRRQLGHVPDEQPDAVGAAE